jgi:hypothetical protein
MLNVFIWKTHVRGLVKVSDYIGLQKFTPFDTETTDNHTSNRRGLLIPDDKCRQIHPDLVHGEFPSALFDSSSPRHWSRIPGNQ